MDQNKVFVIAEAGVNHNGDMATALALVDTAAACDADAVKFQTFRTEKLVTRDARQADYQQKNLGQSDGQFAMLKRLELTADAHHQLVARCRERSIRFMSTAFDDDSIDLLHGLGCQPWKIPSGEITNLPYLRRIGSFGQEVIVSTGMADLGEVENAIEVLEAAGTPRDKLILLHCTTEYPAPFGEVNLRAMQTLQTAFGLRVGYSDHTEGIDVSVAAVAMGACLIEKHFTLDRNMPGPDHKASLAPDELAALLTGIRRVEQAMGDGIKRPTPSELRNREPARKSIVAARPITVGEKFTADNLTTKRPGSGISPMRWDEMLGRTATRNYAADERIEP